MSNIATLLRQLADEIDKAECNNATEIENMKNKIYCRLDAVESKAYKNESKLKEIGRILLED